MNLIVRTEQPGFVENGWVGHELQLGDETRVNVALLDPRCVMPTLAQDDLPQDTDVLRTLVPTIGCKSPISVNSPAPGFTRWSLHPEQYKLAIT